MKRALWTSAWLLVVALLAAGFSALSHLPYWWAFLIAAGAIVTNGLLATLEDDLPGGFNNPDGSATPRYVVVVGRVVHVILIVALVAIALVLLSFARNVGWASFNGMALTLFAIGTAFAYIALKRNRAVGMVGLLLFVGVPAAILWWRHAR
jgi:hypothetical protein